MSRPRCARRARAIAQTYSGAANQATEAWVGPAFRNDARVRCAALPELRWLGLARGFAFGARLSEHRGVSAARFRNPVRVPDDLPKVAIMIAEVAGVDPPRSVVGWCDRGARGSRVLQ